jgi:PhzF family phenazine biosynthesis protein
MDQGKPEFLKQIDSFDVDEIAAALNLSKDNLSEYPLEVISTGLPYLIVPIVSGIENAKIVISHFEELLCRLGAKFVYVLDVKRFEGRTWDNGGNVEDIATGSAAGPSSAYLYKYNLVQGNCSFEISQGRFLGRPS